MEMLNARADDGSCIYGCINYAGEAYDRLIEAKARIETLEAALRGIAYILPKTDSNGIWWHQKVARLALGEKEDGQSMG